MGNSPNSGIGSDSKSSFKKRQPSSTAWLDNFRQPSMCGRSPTWPRGRLKVRRVQSQRNIRNREGVLLTARGDGGEGGWAVE